MDSEELNNPSKMSFFSSFSLFVLVFFFLSFLFFSITLSLSGKIVGEREYPRGRG